MTIYQEDFASACNKPDCEHVNECVTLVPSCHPNARIINAKSNVASVGLSTKAIYSLATNELLIRCAVCDALICMVAVARRSPNLTMVKSVVNKPTIPNQVLSVKKIKKNRKK